MVMLAVVAFASLLVLPAFSRGAGDDLPSLTSDMYSLSQDELIVSSAGLGAGHSSQTSPEEQGGGQK
jgi:hypothetical protein